MKRFCDYGSRHWISAGPLLIPLLIVSGCAAQGEQSLVVVHTTADDGTSVVCGTVAGAKAEAQVDGAQIGAIVGGAVRAAGGQPAATPQGGFGAVSASQPAQPLTTPGTRITYDAGGCKVEIFKGAQ